MSMFEVLESVLSISNEVGNSNRWVVEPLSSSVIVLEFVSKTTSLMPISQVKETAWSMAFTSASRGPKGS